MARKKRIDPFRRKINKPLQKKLVGAFMIAILAFAVLVIRVTYINASKGEEYTKLAEGYYTVRALLQMGKNYGVDLPICRAVYDTLYRGIDPKTALDDLFTRSLKTEFYQ